MTKRNLKLNGRQLAEKGVYERNLAALPFCVLFMFFVAGHILLSTRRRIGRNGRQLPGNEVMKEFCGQNAVQASYHLLVIYLSFAVQQRLSDVAWPTRACHLSKKLVKRLVGC